MAKHGQQPARQTHPLGVSRLPTSHEQFSCAELVLAREGGARTNGDQGMNAMENTEFDRPQMQPSLLDSVAGFFRPGPETAREGIAGGAFAAVLLVALVAVVGAVQRRRMSP